MRGTQGLCLLIFVEPLTAPGGGGMVPSRNHRRTERSTVPCVSPS
jgi:hypothetical protein